MLQMWTEVIDGSDNGEEKTNLNNLRRQKFYTLMIN